MFRLSAKHNQASLRLQLLAPPHFRFLSATLGFSVRAVLACVLSVGVPIVGTCCTEASTSALNNLRRNSFSIRRCASIWWKRNRNFFAKPYDTGSARRTRSRSCAFARVQNSTVLTLIGGGGCTAAAWISTKQHHSAAVLNKLHT